MTPTVDGSIGAAAFAPPPARPEAGWSRRELGRGEALYRAGDSAGTIYRVDEGLLKLVIDAPGGKERILDLAGPGDLLGAAAGEDGSFGETAETVSAQAVISAAPRAALLPDASGDLLRAAGIQVGRMRAALEESDLPVAARIARILLRLGTRFGQRSDDGTVRLTLPLTHEHIASMAGAARETTSTALGDLRRAGLLWGTRGRYRFDPAALEGYAFELALD